jgi:hypothetical protein
MEYAKDLSEKDSLDQLSYTLGFWPFTTTFEEYTQRRIILCQRVLTAEVLSKRLRRLNTDSIIMTVVLMMGHAVVTVLLVALDKNIKIDEIIVVYIFSSLCILMNSYFGYKLTKKKLLRGNDYERDITAMAYGH